MSPTTCQDILRLTPGERRALVEALNNRPNNEEARKNRKGDRYPYLVPEGIAVDLRRDHTPLGKFLVIPRNLSVGGLAFLHGAFVYPGCLCIAQLKARDGQLHEVPGGIVRCRTVHGRIHEVAVAFHKPIEIDNFVDTHTPPEPPEDVPYRANDLAGLARRLLDQAYHGAPLADVRATVLALTHVVRDNQRTRRAVPATNEEMLAAGSQPTPQPTPPA